ncbi:MAG TPA: GGDEF domain-containing protein [Solirubrobacteraceae bacterium]|nr:GGDEF domain-containing protein [Solirubrobacteraceae bacterium]
MAARDPDPSSETPPEGTLGRGSAAALGERLEEEIARAERHGTDLSCLLIAIENLDEIALEHGSDLPERTLAYVTEALRRELRSFDRVGRCGERELLILLPGTSGPLGEVVARRVLARVATIKVEEHATRRALVVSAGLATWTPDSSAAELLTRARTGAGCTEGSGEEPGGGRVGGGRTAARPAPGSGGGGAPRPPSSAVGRASGS